MFSYKEDKETEPELHRSDLVIAITALLLVVLLAILQLSGKIDITSGIRSWVEELSSEQPNHECYGFIYTVGGIQDSATIINYVGNESTVIIPDELDGFIVTKLGDNVFNNNSKINYVKLPSNLESIGNDVFKDCITLREVIFNDSIDSIGDSAFAGCSSIKIVNIPNSVKTIGKDEFIGCYKLDTVNIPMEVTQLGGSTFTRLSYFNKEIVGETSYQFTSEDGISFTRKIN